MDARTYDTDTAHDSTIYCPTTRRPCMGRHCAAAEREERDGGTVWTCTAYPNGHAQGYVPADREPRTHAPAKD